MRPLLVDDPVRRHQWQERAACRDYDSELFIEPDDESRTLRARREQAAKRICAVCPVRAECLRYAESGHELFGVWGGTTRQERAIRRRRRWRAVGSVGPRTVSPRRFGAPGSP